MTLGVLHLFMTLVIIISKKTLMESGKCLPVRIVILINLVFPFAN